MPKLRIRMLPLALFLLLLIIIGAMFYSLFEGWNYVDSLYFTVMTLTTIGYGDLFPTTSITKLFTVAYVLIGVGVLFYALSIFTTYYMEKRSPNISRAVTMSLEHLVERRKKKGDVVLKVETPQKENKPARKSKKNI